jgi:hypothetical protein
MGFLFYYLPRGWQQIVQILLGCHLSSAETAEALLQTAKLFSIHCGVFLERDMVLKLEILNDSFRELNWPFAKKDA